MELLSGQEIFLFKGESIGLTIQDFWRFQYSNIFDLQEYIAEFLIAKALCIDTPYNRNGWTAYDIKYKGKRIEVKETGYFYSWQKIGKHSQRRLWDIHKTFVKDNEGNRMKDEYGKDIKERQSDVYVFCLNIGDDFLTSYPLELDNWEFYIIPTKDINMQCGDHKTISLSKVKKIANNNISFEDIKSEIDKIVNNL